MTLQRLFPVGGAGPVDWEQAYDPGAGPCLRAGLVLSADGASSVAGSSRPLSGEVDRQVFRALRAVADAVLVGAGTVRHEDYGPVRPTPSGLRWRAAHGQPPTAPLVVVSATCNLPSTTRCLVADAPTLVVTCAAADPARRAELARHTEVVVVGQDQVDLAAMLAMLHGRGLTRLLCEGGPALLTALLSADLLDELCLTTAPLLVGVAPALLSRTLPTARPLELTQLLHQGGVLLGRWAVRPQPGPRSRARPEP